MAIDTKDQVTKSSTAKRRLGRSSAPNAGWATVAKIAVVVVLLDLAAHLHATHRQQLRSQRDDARPACTPSSPSAWAWCWPGRPALLRPLGLLRHRRLRLRAARSSSSTCPPSLAWIAGAAAAGFVALIIGRPVLKLKYFYLALATMGLGQIFLAVVFEWKWGGASNGFGPVKPLEHLRVRVRHPDAQVLHGLGGRHHHPAVPVPPAQVPGGRALRGLAVSEIASSTLGVRNANWKLGLRLQRRLLRYRRRPVRVRVRRVSPQNFSFAASVLPIVMMLVGGDRSI